MTEGATPTPAQPSAERWKPPVVWHVEDDDRELWGPSVDVCAFCSDSECDGIGCIARLDPNDLDDHPTIEMLHVWIRRGRYFEQVERVLAEAENRPVPPKAGTP